MDAFLISFLLCRWRGHLEYQLGLKNTTGGASRGTSVTVWWQTEQQFYKGALVRKKNPRCQDPHHIHYDDGDKEWVNLAFRRWRLLNEDSKVKKEESK